MGQTGRQLSASTRESPVARGSRAASCCFGSGVPDLWCLLGWAITHPCKFQKKHPCSLQDPPVCAASVASTVVCHVGGRERAGESLDGGWDPSIVNGPRSAKKKFMDLLKKVQKVYGPPMHFTQKENKTTALRIFKESWS